MTETHELFATAATADQNDAGIGLIWWATHPPGEYALTVLDYDLTDMAAVDGEWIGKVFKRSGELLENHKPKKRDCRLRVEHPGLVDVLKRADAAYRDTKASEVLDRDAYDIRPIGEHEKAKWPTTFDERMSAIRPLVNSGKVVKLETGLRRFSFRAIRTNHLVSQIKQHRPGDAASAGELLHSFVLGVLLGTKPKGTSWFSREPGPLLGGGGSPPQSTPSTGPFGIYVPGRRPL